jgi:prepilin-type processing-associated H-X9-DG protein
MLRNITDDAETILGYGHGGRMNPAYADGYFGMDCNRYWGEENFQRECQKVAAERDRIAKMQSAVQKLADALKPFAHPDLQMELGGNVEGDESIIYIRNKAVLKLSDFRRALAALKAAGVKP